VRAVSKALDVLGLIATGDVMTGRDLALRMGLPKSTAHRLLGDLIALRLVQRAGERLVIGPRIIELAGGRVGAQRLVHVAQPEMVALRDRCRETVALHMLERGGRVLLHQVESTQEHRWVYTNAGKPMPLHAGAAAKMLLALLPEDEARAFMDRTSLQAFTPSTPRDRGRLMRELEAIRRDRYAISIQEVTPGIASIAVPLDTGDRAARAVLCVTGPMMRLNPAALDAIRPLLNEAAAKIARQLSPEPARVPAPSAPRPASPAARPGVNGRAARPGASRGRR
jgi:IclR family acetate operon transcriptional repressor